MTTYWETIRSTNPILTFNYNLILIALQQPSQRQDKLLPAINPQKRHDSATESHTTPLLLSRFPSQSHVMGMCISTETSSRRWPPELRSSRRKSKTKKGAAESCGGGAAVDFMDNELSQVSQRMISNGCSHVACLYTQQGKKGTNQDAMIVWEVI